MAVDFDTGIDDGIEPDLDAQDTPLDTDTEPTEEDEPSSTEENLEDEDTSDSADNDFEGYVPEERYKNLQAQFTKKSQRLAELEKSLNEKGKTTSDKPVDKPDFNMEEFERLREEDPQKAMSYYADSIKQQAIAEIENKEREKQLANIFNSRAAKALESVKDESKRSELLAEMESVYEIEAKDGFTPSPEAAFLLATTGSWEKAIELVNKGLQADMQSRKPKTPKTPPPAGAGAVPGSQSGINAQFRNLREILT